MNRRLLLAIAAEAARGPAPITSSDSDVTAWIAAVGQANTTQAEVSLFTTWAVAGKANGWWARLDRAWCHAPGTRPAAVKDFIARATATESLTTWTANRGFNGDAANAINYNFNPATAGGLYSQNDASCGGWVQTTTGTNGKSYMGSHSTTNNFNKGSATTTGWAVNGGGTTTTMNPTSGVGFQHVERTASNLSTIYHNGVNKGTQANASTALTSANFFGCASNNGAGAAANILDNTAWWSFAFIGKSMGDTIAAAFYADTHTMMTGLSASNFP